MTNATNTTQPTVTVESDYDGYFESLVRSWIDRHEGPFHHTKVVITAGPYRMDAVSYVSADGVIHLDFYSALRTGFGYLGSDEVAQLVELL